MEGAESAYSHTELATGVVDEGGEVVKSIVFREMAGYEEDILASKKMKTSVKMSTLMSNCIIKFGPHEKREVINKLVRKMTISDRWYFLTQLRIKSLGEGYKFKSLCPQCSHEDTLVFDLTKLKIKKAPDANKLFIEEKLPSGNKVRFKIADGEVEEKIENQANDENAATVGLYVRVDSINDEPVSLSDIKSLSWKDRTAFRKMIEDSEGDLDDKYKATCIKCSHEYESELPMDATSFFFPTV